MAKSQVKFQNERLHNQMDPLCQDAQSGSFSKSGSAAKSAKGIKVHGQQQSKTRIGANNKGQ